jgi:hypothetical protein
MTNLPSPARAARLAGALVGIVAALVVAAAGAIREWHLAIGSLGFVVDWRFGLLGVVPAAVAGAAIAPSLALASVRGLVVAAAKMAALSVALGILEILLVMIVGLVVVGPSAFGGSDPSTGWFIIVFGGGYAVVVLGPIATLLLFPPALAWALVVRLILRFREGRPASPQGARPA